MRAFVPTLERTGEDFQSPGGGGCDGGSSACINLFFTHIFFVFFSFPSRFSSRSIALFLFSLCLHKLSMSIVSPACIHCRVPVAPYESDARQVALYVVTV